MVFRLSFGREAFLLTGDLEKQSECAILDSAKGHSQHADALRISATAARIPLLPSFLKG
jgi:beta-lactamase superfamily II metal-dependent hydrolase